MRTMYSNSPRIIYGDFDACACGGYQALFSPPPREPGDEASLDIDCGGAEFPRKLGMGVLKSLGLKGCQIS